MIPSWNLLFLYPPVPQTPAVLFFFSVSTDTVISSQTSSLILHLPPLNRIPVNPSLNNNPNNAPTLTPETTPIKLQHQKSLTLSLPDTEFGLTTFHITPTLPPPHPHIPDHGDIDPKFLPNINKSQSCKPISVSTSIKGRRRHSQFDPSLPLPKPCRHSQPESFLPPLKPLTILLLNLSIHSVKNIF